MTEPNERPPLERVSVNLVPRASRALELAAQLAELSRTDVINRAIQLYAWWEEKIAEGSTFMLKEPNGDLMEIKTF